MTHIGFNVRCNRW